MPYDYQICYLKLWVHHSICKAFLSKLTRLTKYLENIWTEMFCCCCCFNLTIVWWCKKPTLDYNLQGKININSFYQKFILCWEDFINIWKSCSPLTALPFSNISDWLLVTNKTALWKASPNFFQEYHFSYIAPNWLNKWCNLPFSQSVGSSHGG